MKHILMVSHDYLPNIGGVAVYVHELGRALVARGHRVTILTQYRSFGKGVVREDWDGMRVIRIPIVPLKKLDDWQYVRRMRRMIAELERTERVDVVHWQTMNKDAKVMRGLTVQALEVYTNHLSWFRMLFNNGEFSRIRRLIRRPDVIISPSREVESMSAELYGAEHVVYLPNGVDADVFRPDGAAGLELRARYGIAESETVIVSTNRMEPVKGMTYLMAAIPSILSTFDKVTFLVAGDGSQWEEFQQEIAKLGAQAEKVIFTGRLTNGEVQQVVNAADIYVQPSLMEGCSIAIIEAMACGKPVIAADVGGNPDIISKETGILIEPRSSEALREALKICLTEPERRRDMGLAGRRRVELELNWRQLAKDVERVYSTPKP